MSFMPWPLGGLGLHNMQWRLWSVYAKQVISAHIGVNTHPGCLLARVTLSRLTHHSNGISWHSGAALLTARLPSPKLTRGLPWYWARIWQGFMALKPDRLLFPTLREEVARQPLFFNDIYLNPLNRPFGSLSGPNPYEGFITSPHPVTTILHLYILHGDCYRLLTYNELAAWVPNMPTYAAWAALVQAIPPRWHTLMTSPRAPYKAGEWCCFCPYSTTATCSGKVIAELPLGTLHVQLLAPLSGHNGCLAQLTTAVVLLPTQLCHRIRVVPWSLEQSCVYQPNPNLPDAAIIWLHVGSTRLDMLSLDPVEFGWVLNQGDSRIVKGLYEYTAEWGYTMLRHKNHQFHPGRTRWGATEWPGHTWVRNITLAADRHPLIDRRATDVQHLLMHRSIGVGEILHRRFHHPATCLCTHPNETVEHRFLWCNLQGVWTWLIGLWAAWTSEPTIIPVSTRSIIFGITGTPGLELTFSQQAWIWLRTCMLYTIWTPCETMWCSIGAQFSTKLGFRVNGYFY
eukprot:jgi/Mesvir1/16820/Mv25531-RA.1